MLPLTYRSMSFDPPGGWESCLLGAAAQPHAVLLDSAAPGVLARVSALAFAPVMRLACTGQSAHWQRGRSATRLEGDPFDMLAMAEGFACEECPLTAPLTDVVGLVPGWFGLLGFDLRVFVEKLPPPKPQGPLFPDLVAGFYPWVLHFDHDSQRCELRLLDGAPGGPASLEALATQLKMVLTEPRPSGRGFPKTLGPALHHTTRDQFVKHVDEIKTAIYEGEIYQANLTRCVTRKGDVDAGALYGCLRSHSPAPFGGFLDCGDGHFVLSASPERFLTVRDRLIETRPIKGTRARGKTPAEDTRLKQELLASAKDHAELVMIVDLERNDLGRVCEPGSINVPELAACHSYAQVHHLEAIVRGRLRVNAGVKDFLRATFPGGSISGAPKKRALEILHGLEPVRRGPYTGSLFALGHDGRFDSSILIRTLLVEPGQVGYHVGGGIVADSDPQSEYEETLDKARGLEAALEAYAGGKT